jgi:thymidylate synthase
MIYQSSFENNCIIATTIDDAWRIAISLCVRNGYHQVIEGSISKDKGGSYIGQTRKQLEDVKITIKYPYIRPLAPITPVDVPPPTSDEKIVNYFINYLMDDQHLLPNEEYRYATWIIPQLQTIIEKLRISNGNTNQATITIGDSNSVRLKDPPCLKLISFKVVNMKLNMSVFFRSWDLMAGFPENIGGLQLLKEFVLQSLHYNLSIIDGSIICYSDGLHLYDHFWDLADKLTIKG